MTDLVFSNGWYKAPKNPADAWIWHPISRIYGISNNLLQELDADGDLDLIISAGHHGKGVYWYENKLDKSADNWKKHTVDNTIIHPEGLSVVDKDGDGDLDVTACELDFKHWDKMVHNIYLFENRGNF